MDIKLLVREVTRTTSVGILEDTFPVYKTAFAGYPWFEDLSDDEVIQRIRASIARTGFEGIWLYHPDNSELVAASWFDILTFSLLAQERGNELRKFVESLVDNDTPGCVLVWQRETLVNPSYQRAGVGRYIKDLMHSRLQNYALSFGQDLVVLTRMREDNFGIIKINQEFGFQQTGITQPCSIKQGTNHEFWYKIYRSS